MTDFKVKNFSLKKQNNQQLTNLFHVYLHFWMEI